MKKNITFVCCFILSVCTLRLQAQQDQEAMMKAWTAYMTPGDMHKMLAQDDGEWTGEITMWMEPGKEPTKSTGTMTNKMIMGGRYQEGTFKSTMMGQQMEGKGLTAYNNASKQFETTWIDNMGTGIIKLNGTYDPATKTITYTGTQMDPMMYKEVPMKQTIKYIDPKHQTMEMFMTGPNGEEFKSMEIKFTKK